MFKVQVKSAASKAQARRTCRAIANYSLVKCAVHGKDPNWGRIIVAVGSAGVKLNLNKLSCKIGNVTVFSRGMPRKFDARKVAAALERKEHTIEVNLGVGKGEDFCYGCDMSSQYVAINADYHT